MFPLMRQGHNFRVNLQAMTKVMLQVWLGHRVFTAAIYKQIHMDASATWWRLQEVASKAGEDTPTAGSESQCLQPSLCGSLLVNR